MPGLIDLHVHTTASDGTMTPAETVFHAARCGLKAIAITDHDTVEGVPEALAAGEQAGIEVVPGVEISVDHPGEMHILGYYIDPHSAELQHVLSRLRRYRDKRNPLMADKLRRLGLALTMADVAREAQGEIIGRPHFAAVMIKKGYVKDFSQAFDYYLGVGQPAYVKKERLSPKQGINMITSSGGVPVLAHPKYLAAGGRDGLKKLVRELKGYGLQGIEVFYTAHSPEETRKFYNLAVANGLVVTGGTDFHGANKPKIEIGIGEGDLAVDYGILEKLKSVGQKNREEY